LSYPVPRVLLGFTLFCFLYEKLKLCVLTP